MNKVLLTEILDGVTAVHAFLSGDLARESISPDCNQKREKFIKVLDTICQKIRKAPPAMRPRINTPSDSKPPAPPPPNGTLELTEEEEEQELYTAMDAGEEEEPTDYLEFEPSQMSGGELSQEMYEAMTVEHDPDDVYEEPVPGMQGEQAELYEEPTSSSDGRPSTSNSLQPPTPSQSRENSASGAEFIQANRDRAELTRSAVLSDISTDWTMIYSPPKKGSGDSKVSSLKSVAIKGILEKLGGHSKKNWQKRYCVMSGPLMYFYEKESSKSYNNFICVLNFTISEEPSMTNEKKKQFAFKLTHTDTSTGSKKDYCFRAISAETREKWVTAIQKVIQKPAGPPIGPSFSASILGGGSVTLPRMPPSGGPTSASVPILQTKPRSSTVVSEDLYDEMPEPIKEESEEEGEDYLPVAPVHEGTVEELSSSAEYVDVKPAVEDDIEEEYEDTSAYQSDQPPPPMTPPPGPPTSHPPVFPPTPPIPQESSPPRKPPPPLPQVEVDTSKVYTQGSNGITLNRVYVILWDFEAHEQDELGLCRGDLVLVSEPNETSDWWFGELLDNEATKKLGRKGLFPRQYTDLAFDPVTA